MQGWTGSGQGPEAGCGDHSTGCPSSIKATSWAINYDSSHSVIWVLAFQETLCTMESETWSVMSDRLFYLVVSTLYGDSTHRSVFAFQSSTRRLISLHSQWSMVLWVYAPLLPCNLLSNSKSDRLSIKIFSHRFSQVYSLVYYRQDVVSRLDPKWSTR